MTFDCTVNGRKVSADVPDRLLLSDFLRHELKLTGTRVGCEMGICGACTIMFDGEPVRSCLIFAAQAEGAEIRTVESLAEDGSLTRLQVLLSQHHGLQCGFCTPGILMTVTAAAEAGRMPRTESGIRELISGNICRCTGYQGIVDALLDFAA